VQPELPVSYEVAAEMAALSRRLGLQVGVLLSRKGVVEFVVVGESNRITIPDTGRFRASQERLRGLRFIHTHLGDTPLDDEDLTDLIKLRLDTLGVVTVTRDGEPDRYQGAWLQPDANARYLRKEVDPPRSIHAVRPDFLDRVREIEVAFRKFDDGQAVAGGRTRAMLVHVELPARFEAPVAVDETLELAKTAGVDVVEVFTQRRAQPDVRTFIGKGKLDEILQRSVEAGVDLLIFNQELAPGQVKALTEITDLRVIDRTMLILDIFVQRARSADGKLQVELAQLKYRLPRLVQQAGALSRLAGGIGGRGPGETKLEEDRRRIRDRIKLLERQLEQMAKQRRETRKRRGTRGVPVVSLVGYTNAGKSTLLNTLTGADVRAKNELFSTLDPTARRLRFPDEREIVLTDTVGFIEHLPPAILAAFRATLEELLDSDLLLHVVDLTSPRLERHIQAVEQVLADLELTDVPRLLVFNKLDLAGDGEDARSRAALHGAVPISARNAETTRPLVDEMAALLWQSRQTGVEIL
jgi:GTP-binding protein HflX